MRISDEALVHPDRYDDLLMFKVAFVSEIFFAGSGRPLYGFIFWALQVCRSFHLRHPWDGFLLLRPSQRKKWRWLRQWKLLFITRLGAPVVGKCGKKATDDRRTGQAWILDFKKNQFSAIPFLENACHISLHLNSDAERAKTFSYNAPEMQIA